MDGVGPSELDGNVIESPTERDTPLHEMEMHLTSSQ
jgi:hypothetical protein